MEDKNNNQNNNAENYEKLVQEYQYFCSIIKIIEEKINEVYEKPFFNNSNIYKKCYLFEKSDYENYKEKISYNTYISDNEGYRDEINLKIGYAKSENKEINLEKLKQINVKSVNELNSLLKENHEYILINVDLIKKIIENEKEGQYDYCINPQELIIKI